MLGRERLTAWLAAFCKPRDWGQEGQKGGGVSGAMMANAKDGRVPAGRNPQPVG